MVSNAVFEDIWNERASRSEYKMLEPGDIAQKRYYEEDTSELIQSARIRIFTLVPIVGSLLSGLILGRLPSKNSFLSLIRVTIGHFLIALSCVLLCGLFWVSGIGVIFFLGLVATFFGTTVYIGLMFFGTAFCFSAAHMALRKPMTSGSKFQGQA